jgi:hypothetical protein
MPDVPVPIKAIDSIQRVPYRIGYSFRQPGLVKPVTVTRQRPYFAMNWAGSVDEKKQNLYKSGVLQRFPSTWRRSAKSMAVAGLGVVGNRRELPDFNELGDAPGPTDKETTTSSTSRDFFGFLDNTIKQAGGLIAQSQQLEIAKAQAQGPYARFLPNFYTPSTGIGVMGWVAIASVLGAGAYFMMKRSA